MAALATMTMGELNEGQKQVYPLFQKNASMSIYLEGYAANLSV